ncbi:Sodium/calcium exchanger protein-domain-containing protein [Mucor mucedo]|uniref:Sodium/calcium exchanger protein-domain-containing protein n=1 Tax=Mucor mucedo TaxID=29922 RepID=UPI00221EE4FE|nr:Sodium/calcium exchanger protein-domain-containing protein [Mucor mucedo]KAI7891391.1 Sodium/calcium exchanger protein-domain-containing protein [Mucor mucedo]
MSIGKSTVAILSILLISKCITYAWSNAHDISSHTLVRRDQQFKCDNIYLQQDQCGYVLEHCMDATPGLFNYIQLYYCSSFRPLVFIFMCGWLLFLFGFVGIAASDFFCPNLQTIASALHLSESLTGVTFLALGNGSPDLFSTFSAMHSNLGSLALGELIGAAAFIVSVVAGSMCAIKPFRAKKFSFIRDVSFFTCAIILVMVIVSDGLIHLYESIILILFYVVYVLVVVGGNYYMKKRSNYLNLVERARLEYEENGTDVDILLGGNDTNDTDMMIHDDEMELYDEGFETEGYQDFNHQRNGVHPKLRIRTSLFSAIEFQDVVQSLKSTSTRFNTTRRRNRSLPTQQHFPSRTSNYEDYTDELSLHTADSQHGVPTVTSNTQKITALFDQFFSSSKRRYMRHQIQKHLFPSFIGFRKKSIFSKTSSVLSAPVFFLLAITLPVVKENALSSHASVELNDDTAQLLQDYNDNEDQQNDILLMNAAEDATWLKWLTAVQLVGAPTLISFVLISQHVVSPAIVLPVAFLSSAALSLSFWFTTKSTKQPRLYWMMCFIGFAIAVVWIFLIANEVVSVLQAIGMAVGASEAILGLTIFALGNSLGDFVANVTMAKMGYPLMAMSACFGGPMLNIMLGVGIGATYVTSQRNEPYAIDVSKTIVVTAVGLLVVLISSLILVPLNGYRMSRGFGYSWIAIYLICTTINLYIEIMS